MTRYHWDIDKEPLEDPNRKLFLCEECDQEYYELWNNQWEEYYATQY